MNCVQILKYCSETKTENTKSNLKPPEELPPPKRNRTLLGGVDYYSLSYNDPIYDDEDYYFVCLFNTFQYL
jgi:hypothetical protein